MKKKITKTIIAIVFVMFLGIKNVEAKDEMVDRTCFYEGPDATTIKITVPTTRSTPTIHNGANGSIKNWGSSDSGFDGLKYYVDNNRKCPPKIVIAEYTFSANDIFFTDDSSESNVREYAKSKASIGGFKYSDFVGNLKTDDNKIISRTCRCSGELSGVNANFRYQITSDIMSSPNVTIRYNGTKTDNENIVNWNSIPLAGNNYKFVDALATENRCSDYALITGLGEIKPTKVYLTYTGNLTYLKTALHQIGENDHSIWILSCEESSSGDDPSSNSNSNSNEPDDPDDPGLDPNIPRTSDDSVTYSCGSGFMTNIPSTIPRIGKFIYNLFLILIPLIIIILGSIDLVKAISSQKEDEIAKGRKVFIKRVIEGIIIFFAFAIVKLAISLVTPESKGIVGCMDCILNNNKSCVKEQ